MEESIGSITFKLPEHLKKAFYTRSKHFGSQPSATLRFLVGWYAEADPQEVGDLLAKEAQRVAGPVKR